MCAMVERKKHIAMIIFIRNSMKKNIRVIIATVIMLTATHITFSILLPVRDTSLLRNSSPKGYTPRYNDSQIRICRGIMNITEDKWNRMNSAERERAMRLSYFYRGLY